MYHWHNFTGTEPAASICPRPSMSLPQWELNTVAAAQLALMEKTRPPSQLSALLYALQTTWLQQQYCFRWPLKEAVNLS